MDRLSEAIGQLGWREDTAEARRLERESVERATITRRLVGVDVGQRLDYTAIAVVDEHENGDMVLVALERTRSLLYPMLARLIAKTVQALATGYIVPEVLVDVTGVGRPVTDQLDELEVSHTRVNIHGGAAINKLDDGTLSVPKRDLIAALAVRFEAKTLTIADGLKHTETLEKEAREFTMKLSASGHDTYNAREGKHDDLLLALSLPVWWAKYRQPGQMFIF